MTRVTGTASEVVIMERWIPGTGRVVHLHIGYLEVINMKIMLWLSSFARDVDAT